MARARRVAALAAAAAAGCWLVVWWHQRLAHGATSENERNVVVGLTWMDSGKFLVVPFSLMLVSVVALERSLGAAGRLARIGAFGSVGALAAVGVGTALQFWGFDWGSYEQSFEEGSIGAGGALQAVATLVLTAALAALAVAAARRGVLAAWAVPILPTSGLTTFWLTPTTVVPALAWLAFAAVVAGSARRPSTTRG